MIGSAGVVETAAGVQRWRSRWNLGTVQRSAAVWMGSCDAGVAAGSGCGSVGDDGAAAVVAAAAVADGGAAVFAGAAAGAGAGSSVMR